MDCRPLLLHGISITMSDVEFQNLERRDQDFLRLLAAKCHIGVDTVSNDMKP